MGLDDGVEGGDGSGEGTFDTSFLPGVDLKYLSTAAVCRLDFLAVKMNLSTAPFSRPRGRVRASGARSEVFLGPHDDERGQAMSDTPTFQKRSQDPSGLVNWGRRLPACLAHPFIPLRTWASSPKLGRELQDQGRMGVFGC